MSSTPQFGTAEYSSASGPNLCKSCQQELTGTYFRINGSLACEKCTRQLQAQTPKDTHSVYVRGILFGIGGAIAGLILYSAFGIITGIEIGYVALAVGWLVGSAIRKGSNGVGGRRYQIAAVALTYAAVSLSAVPIGLSYLMKEKKPAAASTASASPSAGSAADPGGTSPSDDTVAPAQPATQQKGLGALVGALLFAGLASPFLELQAGFPGIIGLVIIFVGMRIAWKMTGAPPLEILGPFQANAPPAAPSA
jgi:predicted lipid-binding transport protein (Tim44 family)